MPGRGKTLAISPEKLRLRAAEFTFSVAAKKFGSALSSGSLSVTSIYFRIHRVAPGVRQFVKDSIFPL
jgi:hypothetical protein